MAGGAYWLWQSLSGVGRTESCGVPTCTRYAPVKTRVPLLPRSVSLRRARPRGCGIRELGSRGRQHSRGSRQRPR